MLRGVYYKIDCVLLRVWRVTNMRTVESRGSSDPGVETLGPDPDSPLPRPRDLRNLIRSQASASPFESEIIELLSFSHKDYVNFTIHTVGSCYPYHLLTGQQCSPK